jgi:hypothetical protein
MLTLLIALAAAIALAQTGTAPDRPTQLPAQRPGGRSVPVAVPVGGVPYGGWGYTGGGTAAGNAMNGMASVISSAGSYNQATSEAAINMTQAQRAAIQNDQLYANTYFELRATNRAARAAERGPRPTMEQLVRIAQQGAPRPLPPGALDPVSGGVAWPELLKTADYNPQRTELNELFAKRAELGGLGFSDQTKARQAVDGMFATLKEQIRSVPSGDYAASRSFLDSLVYVVAKTDLD